MSRVLAIAGLIAVALLPWTPPASAGVTFQVQITRCNLDAKEANLPAFDEALDPDGHLRDAERVLACGLEVAERYANEEFFDEDGPTTSEVNRMIRRFKSLLRRVEKVKAKTGAARAAELRKLHVKLADARRHAGDDLALLSANQFLGIRLADDIEALDEALVRIVTRFALTPMGRPVSTWPELNV